MQPPTLKATLLLLLLLALASPSLAGFARLHSANRNKAGPSKASPPAPKLKIETADPKPIAARDHEGGESGAVLSAASVQVDEQQGPLAAADPVAPEYEEGGGEEEEMMVQEGEEDVQKEVLSELNQVAEPHPEDDRADDNSDASNKDVSQAHRKVELLRKRDMLKGENRHREHSAGSALATKESTSRALCLGGMVLTAVLMGRCTDL